MEKKQETIDLLMVRYFSGEITDEEREELFRWIESSKENHDYFAELKNIWQTSHPPFSPNEIDTERAYRLVKSHMKRKVGVLTWFMRAAAVLFIPLLSLSVYLLTEKEQSDPESFQTVFAPYGTCSYIELSDGSKVHLNAGSSLKFPTAFKSRERNVYLEEEGYFEVTANPDHPFIVQTEKLTVTATGTKFQVEDYKTDSMAAVTMEEGIVNAQISAQTRIGLTAGKRLYVKKNSNKYSLETTDPYKWIAWKDGIMIFRDDPLSYVFKRLSLTFNVDIEIKDQRLANHPYRATFKNESLEEILRLLKVSAPIVYKEKRRKTNDYNSKRFIEVHYTN